MTTEEILRTYLPEGQKHERRGQVILLPVSAEGLAGLVLHLYRAQQLPLKTMTALDEGGFSLIYVFGVPGSTLFLAPYLRLQDGVEEFPSLAVQIPELGGYERYVYTFFGLTPAGYAGLQRSWLHGNWPEGAYPLRKSFPWNERPATAEVPYSYKVIEGEGVYEVSVGPVHAGIIEPGHFRFSQAGEEIINLEASLGYVHKGTEKLFEVLPMDQKVRLAERVSGDSSFTQSAAFCQAVEQLAGLRLPARAERLRVLFIELERIANHLNDIAFVMNDTAYTFGGSQGTRLREGVMRWNERLTGSRFFRGMNSIGGLSKDVDDSLLAELRLFLVSLEKDFSEVIEIAEASTSMVNRLEGSGVVRQVTARDLGAVGMAARACGLARDSRADYPHPVYQELGFTTAIELTGDVRARYSIRVSEVRTSLRMLESLLTAMPAGEVATEKEVVLPASSFAVGLAEAWRGEVVYLVATDAAGEISRVQVRDPSFLNWPLATFAARTNVILDFPLINKSFNFSYSGNDL